MEEAIGKYQERKRVIEQMQNNINDTIITNKDGCHACSGIAWDPIGNFCGECTNFNNVYCFWREKAKNKINNIGE